MKPGFYLQFELPGVKDLEIATEKIKEVFTHATHAAFKQNTIRLSDSDTYLTSLEGLPIHFKLVANASNVGIEETKWLFAIPNDSKLTKEELFNRLNNLEVPLQMFTKTEPIVLSEFTNYNFLHAQFNPVNTPYIFWDEPRKIIENS